MPLNIPSPTDLANQATANFQARIEGADTALARAVLPIVAKVTARVAYYAYRALRWVSQQFFVASAQAPYLDRRLGEVNLPRIEATAAAGNVVFAGAVSAPIGAGTVVQTLDQSQSYTVGAAATVGSGGTISVPVTANTTGSAGNQLAGAALIIVTAIANVQPTVTVDTGGIGGGTDAETDDAYRVRGLARLAQPPQGGAGSDFLAWAKAAGVFTRAWVFPLNRGDGTCDVAGVIDTQTDKLPSGAQNTAVQNYIAGVKPVIGDSQVFTLTEDALSITISGLVGTGGVTQTALQAAISAQLNALVATVPPGGATYGDGVSTALPPSALFPLQAPGKLYLNQIEAAIEAAGNVLSYDLAAPTADVVFATGHLPAAPTIAYT